METLGLARLEQVLKGIKKVQARGPKKAPRLPITPDRLLKMKWVWSREGDNWDTSCYGQRRRYVFLVFSGQAKELFPRKQRSMGGHT